MSLLLLAPEALAQDKYPKGLTSKEGSFHHVDLRARAGQPVFQAKGGNDATLAEDFDDVPNGEIPDGWARFEAGTGATAGEDVNEWAVLPYDGDDPSLGKAVGVFFENVAAGEAIDYLVTPQVSISDGDRLRATLFELFNDNFGSTYEVRVSTGEGDSADDFTDLLATFTEDDLPQLSDRSEFTFDLSAYAGQDIFIAFVFINDDGDAFVIDDVFVEAAPTGPVLAVSSSEIDFGRVAVGLSGTETVTISNAGGDDLTISSITVTGGSFEIDDTNTATTLAPGDETDLVVTFTAPSAGEQTGSISIVSDDPDSPTSIALVGIGAVPPDNDDIADATPISEFGAYTGTNVDATLQDGEPVPSCQPTQGASVFWAYTPAMDALVTIDLSASDFDTVLTFHEADGTEIACNDDGGALTTSLLSNLSVTAGTTYLIRVAGFNGAEGNIAFGLSETRQPDLVFSGETTRGPIDRAFVSSTTGNCSVSSVGSGVSYGLTDIEVSADGVFDFVLTDFALDGVLAIYSDFDPADVCANVLTYRDTNGDGNGETQADVSLSAGTYSIFVSGFEASDIGTYTVEVYGMNVVVVNSEEGTPVVGAGLSAPAPNPASGVATFSLAADTPERVAVTVYDMLGRAVAEVFDGQVAAGEVSLAVDTATLPAGQYVIRARGESFVSTQRLTVVR